MNHGRLRIANMMLVLDALADRLPHTKHDLVKALNISLSAVSSALRELSYGEAVHIAAWVRHLERSGCYTPQFAAGDGIDAPKPVTFSSAEKQRRYRGKRERLCNPFFGGLRAPRARE